MDSIGFGEKAPLLAFIALGSFWTRLWIKKCPYFRPPEAFNPFVGRTSWAGELSGNAERSNPLSLLIFSSWLCSFWEAFWGVNGNWLESLDSAISWCVWELLELTSIRKSEQHKSNSNHRSLTHLKDLNQWSRQRSQNGQRNGLWGIQETS